jgi:methyl-accepting chemotaxis protein
LREPSDIRGVPRFSPNPNRPEHLVASIVALSEQTNRLALESALEAARADTLGKVTSVVEQVCRLAVGAGVAAGEIAWLVSELEASHPTEDQLGEAAVAVSGMQSCMSAVAFAVGDVASRGGPVEIGSSAEALRRVAAQLEGLLNRIQPCV